MECVKGVLEGKTYQQVADEQGYASRGNVHRIVNQTLAQHEVETIEELRALELARLDGLQAAFFGDAVAGDVKAAEVVLKVITARTRLLQLDRVVTSEPPTANNVVTVGGTTAEYVAALRAGLTNPPC